MANLIGLIVARNRMSGIDLRELGVGASKAPMRFYGSDQIHSCHQRAMEAMGLGNRALRRVRIRRRAAGWTSPPSARPSPRIGRPGCSPACVIATAGTVNTGAIDDLEAIADLCAEEGPVDARRRLHRRSPGHRARRPGRWFGASRERIQSRSTRTNGCTRHSRSAASWSGDADAHFRSFTLTPEYLESAPRGIASGAWLHDFGLQTSRGFRALKVWMALKEHGVVKFGRLIEQDLAHARYLAERIEATPDLTLCFSPAINIVCFRYDPGGLPEATLKRLNTDIMVRMQISGVAAVSDTTVRGRHCLRAAINNHRTTRADLDILVDEVARQGAELLAEPDQDCS